MTWTRIVAIPFIVWVFYSDLPVESRNFLATTMFVVFAITDWLDGYLARKLNQTSSFGAFLDPVADKFLVCAALLMLVHLHRVHVLVALIIIGREIAISALREWMAQIGASKSVAVHFVGKLKTTVQMVAIPFLLYNGQLFGVIDTHLWGTGLIWIASILTIWSMIYYMQKALPEIRARVKCVIQVLLMLGCGPCQPCSCSFGAPVLLLRATACPTRRLFPFSGIGMPCPLLAFSFGFALRAFDGLKANRNGFTCRSQASSCMQAIWVVFGRRLRQAWVQACRPSSWACSQY